MRTLGRIILFIVGGVMIGFAVPSLINTINYMNSIGWNLTSSDPNLWPNFSLFLYQGFSGLCGLIAVLAALRGRGSFLLFLFSLILIGGVVWYFVSAYQAGTLGDWKAIVNTCLGFALPILYFIGNIFVRL